MCGRPAQPLCATPRLARQPATYFWRLTYLLWYCDCPAREYAVSVSELSRGGDMRAPMDSAGELGASLDRLRAGQWRRKGRGRPVDPALQLSVTVTSRARHSRINWLLLVLMVIQVDRNLVNIILAYTPLVWN